MSVRSFQFDANDYLFQLIQFYFKLDIIEKWDGRHKETQADRKKCKRYKSRDWRDEREMERAIL